LTHETSSLAEAGKNFTKHCKRESTDRESHDFIQTMASAWLSVLMTLAHWFNQAVSAAEAMRHESTAARAGYQLPLWVNRELGLVRSTRRFGTI
jgi:hypothetical protein